MVFNNAVLRLYCKYLQIGTRYRRPENGVATAYMYMPTKYGELWSTNGENGTGVSIVPKSTFLDVHLRGYKGRYP